MLTFWLIKNNDDDDDGSNKNNVNPISAKEAAYSFNASVHGVPTKLSVRAVQGVVQ